MNYAEELVKEIEKEAKEEKWEAEDFMNYFYSPNKTYKTFSGEGVSGKNIIFASFILPETSFKFNYIRDKQEPLKELGIEVYN